MKRRILLAITLLIAALSLTACASGGTQSVSEESAAAFPSEAPMADFAAGESMDAEMGVANQIPRGQERLIIRTADMSITAADTEALLRLADTAPGSPHLN